MKQENEMLVSLEESFKSINSSENIEFGDAEIEMSFPTDPDELFAKKSFDETDKKVQDLTISKEEKGNVNMFKDSVIKNGIVKIKEEVKVVESVYAKPEFSIIVDGIEKLIKIRFSYDKDMIELFKNTFSTAKYDNNNKSYVVNFNKLNVNKVDQFVNDCYDTFGDLREYYNFKLDIIKEEVKEVKRFSLSEELNIEKVEVKKKEKTSKSLKVKELEGQFISKDEGEVEEYNVNGFKKKSIYDQNETLNQTPEEISYSIMKSTIKINRTGGSLFAYDDFMGCYHYDEDEGIKTQLLRKLLKNGLSSYTSESRLNSIEKSIRNYAKADYNVSTFDNKFVAVRLKNSTTLDNATVFISYKDDGSRAFRVIESSSKLECRIFADVELDAELIKDEKGNVWCGEDLNENKFYYEFKCNKESHLYKLFLDTLFESENFSKMAQRYFGSIFTSEIVFKALFLCGEGNDGKTVLLDILKDIFKHITVSFKLNKEDPFQYEILKNKLFCFVSEITEEGFDETMFKNMTGGDETRVNGKFIKRMEIDTKNMYVAIAMNYKDMFRIKNVDNAMRRRLAFVRCKTSPRILSHFSKKLMNGFFFEEGNYEVESQKLEMVHWLMEGALEALETKAFQDKAITAEKYGQDAEDFFEKMISKMSPKGEFFKEFDFKILDDYTAVPFSDIYNYYENWAVDNKEVSKLGSTNFKKKLIDYINEKFNVRIDEVDMRAQVKNANKRALPVQIVGSDLDSYSIQRRKHLVDCRIISQEKFDKDNNRDIEVSENAPF